MRFRLGLPVLALMLSTLPATAWDGEAHAAIVRAAIRLSGAAEARIPAEYRDALLQATGEADPNDKTCEYHPRSPAPRDAAASAERVFNQLKSGLGLEKPYARAQAMGRFLHYVADCAVPQAIQARPDTSTDLFINRTFVIFRQPRALQVPLAASLRERVPEGRWADPGDDALTAGFRAAVNLVTEALLLLPARPGSEGALDDGPVLFVVNRADNGLSGSTMVTSFVGSGTLSVNGKTESVNVYEDKVQGPLGQKAQPTVAERGGLQVLEWVRRGSTSTVRVVLFNNDDRCASSVTLSVGDWKATLPGRIRPYGLRELEIAGPAAAPGNVKGVLKAVECAGPFPADTGASAFRRVVVPGTAHQRFEGEETTAEKAKTPFGVGRQLKLPEDPK